MFTRTGRWLAAVAVTVTLGVLTTQNPALAYDSSASEWAACSSSWNGWKYGGRALGGYSHSDVTWLNSGGSHYGLMFGRLYGYTNNVRKCYPKGSWVSASAPSIKVTTEVRLTGGNISSCSVSAGYPSGVSASCTWSPSQARFLITSKCGGGGVTACSHTWDGLRVTIGTGYASLRWWETTVTIYRYSNFTGSSYSWTIE